jgi:hypothetical protein
MPAHHAYRARNLGFVVAFCDMSAFFCSYLDRNDTNPLPLEPDTLVDLVARGARLRRGGS